MLHKVFKKFAKTFAIASAIIVGIITMVWGGLWFGFNVLHPFFDHITGGWAIFGWFALVVVLMVAGFSMAHALDTWEEEED